MTVVEPKHAKAASWFGIVRPKIPYFAKREHLPCVDPELMDRYSEKEWNEIIEFLADAASKQPFGDPYYWQSHEKASFVHWLRSWKV